MSHFHSIGISEKLDVPRIRKLLTIGASLLHLAGDLILGWGTEQESPTGILRMLSACTGTSDGGMVAQVYVQKYPGETGGLVLISTGGLDANTIKSLKRQYFFAPLALWYLKHCNYEKLKPKLIRLGMSHLRGEGPEEAAYAQDMFETIFRDYRQEKDDYFSEKMQRDLIRLMHEPRIAYVSGGHLTTVLQAEKFIETIRAFLPSLGSNADRRE